MDRKYGRTWLGGGLDIAILNVRKALEELLTSNA